MGNLTDKGYQITTYNEYLDSIVGEMQRTIPGFSTTDSNPLMMLNKSVASMMTKMSELGAKLYNSRSVLYATDNALDGLVRNVGIRRKASIRSTGYVTFVGRPETVIPAFTRVKTVSGIIFETSKRHIIAENGQITVGVIANVGGINGNVSEGKINRMVNPINGVYSVNNQHATVGGSNSESDVELRIRYFDTLGATGSSTLASIKNGVLKVDNVRSVSVLENVLDFEDRGIAPHGIKVFVVGGDDDAILDSIYTHKAAGIETSGTIEKEYEGKYTIRFARPTTASVKVKINALVEYDVWQEGYMEVIKANINEYISELKVGDKVQYHRIVGCIYNSTQGIKSFTLQMAKGNGEFGTQDLGIAENEQATIDISDIELVTNFG